MRTRCAFTLIELIVVIVIIAVLTGLLLPALAAARRSGRTLQCLSNMRQMETAHWAYMTDYDGWFIDAALAHGGSSYDESAAWIHTLSDYYGTPLLARSPVDDSPHWGPAPAGEPIPGASDPNQRRRTSYGVNNYLTERAPFMPYRKLEQVPRPSVTVHFVIMAFRTEFAGADHPHVENWGADASTPVRAARQLEIHAHGDPKQSFDSVSNYGFLDGHAETAKFGLVYRDFAANRFDPAVAR